MDWYDDNYCFQSSEEKRMQAIQEGRLYSTCVGASLHGCVTSESSLNSAHSK